MTDRYSQCIMQLIKHTNQVGKKKERIYIMAAIYKGTLGLIGNTPLVEPVNLEKELGLEATILVKLEYLNPAGSVRIV